MKNSSLTESSSPSQSIQRLTWKDKGINKQLTGIKWEEKQDCWTHPTTAPSYLLNSALSCCHSNGDPQINKDRNQWICGWISENSLKCCSPIPGMQSALTPRPWKAGKGFFLGREVPTWTDEDVFHGEHGCNGKQEILTVQGSSFYHSTGQVGREGKLHQEFSQSGHMASPYTRKKKIIYIYIFICVCVSLAIK